jgi:ABC-2 type transport system ATP-binding protein
MQQMGKKVLRIALQQPVAALPPSLSDFHLALDDGGRRLTYTYDTKAERTGIARLLAALAEAGISVADLDTEASSLEEIFMGLVHSDEGAAT